MDETDDPPELLALAGDTGGSFPASPAVQSNEGALSLLWHGIQHFPAQV